MYPSDSNDQINARLQVLYDQICHSIKLKASTFNLWAATCSIRKEDIMDIIAKHLVYITRQQKFRRKYLFYICTVWPYWSSPRALTLSKGVMDFKI